MSDGPARPDQALSVTHRFTVELTDNLEPAVGAKLMTRDEAKDVLDDVLYRGDKHAAFTLSIVDEETLDG